jgi:hypothetical protein
MIDRSHLTESLNAPTTCWFRTSYTHIPAACKFQWTDDYYQGKHGIVAVCDRNAGLAGNYQFWAFLRFSSLFVGFAILYYVLGIRVSKNQHDEELAMLDDVQAVYFLLISMFLVAMAFRADLQQRQQHVAVTTEGIRIDHGAAMTIIIPFETIHSCQAQPSTKYMCGFLEQTTLSRVRVVRSLAPLEQVCFRKTRHLELYGLLQPQEMVELIQAMQDSQQHGTYEGGGTEMVVPHRPPELMENEQPQLQPQHLQQLQNMPVVAKV